MSRPLRVLQEAATAALIVVAFGIVLGAAWAGGYWAGAEAHGGGVAASGGRGGAGNG